MSVPLGDSITEITCWRSKVWDKFVDAGISGSVDFVGSMTNNPQNCVSKDSAWDKGHEGHSGYLAINIANTNLEGWLRSAKPDVVQFMLGTNDVFQGRTLDAILQAYTKIVTLSRASNPNMKIIVSYSWFDISNLPSATDLPCQVDTVIPLPMNNQPIVNLNNAIPAWAEGLNTTQSPIYVADVYGYPYPPTDLRDGVHPNDAGDVIIADVVAPVLINVVKAYLSVNTTVY
jgi:lysophospholipase L1-like esterase